MTSIGAWILVAALAACTPAQRRHASNLTLGAALISTSCDWGQTRSGASAHWRTSFESNPILGETPSTSAVDAYFAIVAIGTVLVSQALPEQARPWFHAAVALVELDTVVYNLTATSGLCGVAGAPVR